MVWTYEDRLWWAGVNLGLLLLWYAGCKAVDWWTLKQAKRGSKENR